jgi:regulator of CtrA degradation
MHTVARQSAPETQLLFLPGVFNETLSLLFDSHHYFQSRGSDEQASIDPALRVSYSQEMTRVTMRLTSVMAWLMVRRAVYAGRIEEEKASDSYRLDGAEVCLENQAEIMANMPYYLRHLSERSLDVYTRIHRLDKMAYGKPSASNMAYDA